MALSETHWQQLVAYKDARIEALEKENKWLNLCRDQALKDYDLILQANNDTMDFINSKLYTNG